MKRTSGFLKKICVVTSSRADYSFLYWILRELQENSEIELQLLVTGSHLSSSHGHTIDVITKDGFKLDACIDLSMDDDSPTGVAHSMALAIEGFSRELKKLSPDWMIVLGDRFEIFSVVQAAMLNRIAIAHLGGGDKTEGAIDEAIRHGITKMSHLHFVSNEEAGKRVRQLGEDPERIHVVGSTAIDCLLKTPEIRREDFFKEINFEAKSKNLLVTFHPETLSRENPSEQFIELLNSLDSFGDEFGIIFTRPNADVGNSEINLLLDTYVSIRPWAKAYTSLGQRLYINAIRHCDVVIGNSSSGLYEVPSLKKPTVNIGDRQKGRAKASSVMQADCTKLSIIEAIKTSLSLDCTNVINPYGDGNASPRVVEKILSIEDSKLLLKKRFFDWEENH